MERCKKKKEGAKKKRSVSGGVEPPILRLTVARLNQLGHETEDLFRYFEFLQSFTYQSKYCTRKPVYF